MKNMTSIPFIQGFIIGLSIAAPVGPVGLLCIRRSLMHGWRMGFITGLGAATADALYGCIAAFGLAAVAAFLNQHTFLLNLAGGIFLLYLGFRTALSQAGSKMAPEELRKSAFSMFISTILLTLTNPATIFSFMGVFAGIGIREESNMLAAGTLVIGVFAGSALWWLLLSSGVSLFRARLNTRQMKIINLAAGLILMTLGAWSLTNLI